MKISLQSSPFNRADLFEAAGFEVTENVWRSEEDMINMIILMLSMLMDLVGILY